MPFFELMPRARVRKALVLTKEQHVKHVGFFGMYKSFAPLWAQATCLKCQMIPGCEEGTIFDGYLLDTVSRFPAGSAPPLKQHVHEKAASGNA